MYVITRQVDLWEVILFPNGKDLCSSGKKGLNLDSGLPWGKEQEEISTNTILLRVCCLMEMITMIVKGGSGWFLISLRPPATRETSPDVNL